MMIDKVQAKECASYSGQVTIQFLKGRKAYRKLEVKNNGTLRFFEILCNAVAGNNFSAYMPKYVGIFNVVDNTAHEVNLTRAHFNKVNVGSDVTTGDPFVEFTFVFPGSSLQNNEYVNQLRLFYSTDTSSDNNLLATVDVATPFRVSSDSNLMITWKLSFMNLPLA